MDKERLYKLIEAITTGKITPEERDELLLWYRESSYVDGEYADSEDATMLRMLNRLLRDTGYTYRPSMVRRFRKWLPYAVAAVLVAALTMWYVLENSIINEEPRIAEEQDISPGGNRATLKLADGNTITLDETRNGIIIDGAAITYNDGDALVEVNEKGKLTWLEMVTPKGGTYQVTLPDGTLVWLNAASTLKYPFRFSDTERLVKLDGEAYFLVARDAKKPFKVVSAGQKVEVLGTEFNVSAYSDDPETKTTLVEGKVRLYLANERNRETAGKSDYVELVPGEQGVTQGENLAKTHVDTALYTAWKSGNFYFKRTPVEEIMRQVARWYDVEIKYEGDIPSETLSGDINRNVSLLGLLDILKQSTINVSLEGRILTVHEVK